MTSELNSFLPRKFTTKFYLFEKGVFVFNKKKGKTKNGEKIDKLNWSRKICLFDVSQKFVCVEVQQY